jgi:hypothetical protein
MNLYRGPDSDAPDAVPPGCRPAVDRLQAFLDDRRSPNELLADPHVAGCADCRDRVRAAGVVLDLLSFALDAVTVPAGFADAVSADLLADRRRRLRFAARAVGGLAVAACLAVAFGVWWNQSAPDVVKNETPHPRTEPERAPPPRLGDQFAEAGDAIRSLTAKAADPPMPTPNGFGPLAGVFTAPPPMPLEPAAQSLSALPDAARASLEPVTGPAYRAFSRLLEDVSAVQPGEKPKS